MLVKRRNSASAAYPNLGANIRVRQEDVQEKGKGEKERWRREEEGGDVALEEATLIAL